MKKSEVTDRYLRDCNLVLLIFATVVHDYFESDEYPNFMILKSFLSRRECAFKIDDLRLFRNALVHEPYNFILIYKYVTEGGEKISTVLRICANFITSVNISNYNVSDLVDSIVKDLEEMI